MANFPNTAETNESTSADFYLLRQGTIDVKQNRETLAAGLSNARWTALVDYDEGSNVVGSNGENYKAVQESGPNTTPGAIDPTTDTTATYWTIPSAGATGSGGDQVFYENDQNVTADYTITAGKNAMSAGPVTVNPGVVVTIPVGSEWTVV